MATIMLRSGIVDLLVTLFVVFVLEPIAGRASDLWSQWSNTRNLMKDKYIYGSPPRSRCVLEDFLVIFGARGEFGDRRATLRVKFGS